MTEPSVNSRYVDIVTWAAVLLGLIFRVAHFQNRGPFWGDEAAIAFNLLNRSFLELTRPLDLSQAAPVGFLMLEKAVGILSGMSESALRLPSLIAGVSILAMAALALRSIYGHKAAAVGTLILSISPELIHFSSELKPYSLDAAVALGLLILSNRVCDRGTGSAWLALGLTGVLAPWFSFPSIFVLAGSGGVLLAKAALFKDQRQLRLAALVSVVWALSFAIQYFFFLREASKNSTLLDYWTAAFAPFPPRSRADLIWYATRVANLFSSPIGLGNRYVAVVAFLAGCRSIWLRRRTLLFLTLAALVPTLVASALKKYPFADRLVLFLVPALVVPIAVSLADLFSGPRWARKAVGLVVLAILLVPPARLDATRFLEDVKREQARISYHPMYEYLKENYRGDDRFVVSRELNWVHSYYALKYRFIPSRLDFLTKGPIARDEFLTILNERGPSRVWLLFSLFRSESPGSERQRLATDLPSSVKLAERRDEPRAGYALYRFETAPE
jgi:hypothetical protein